MSKLYYDITISEAIMDDHENIQEEINSNLPHHKQIAAYLPKEWDKCNIHTTFDGILKDKITNTRMTVTKRRTGETVARVTITFKPGLRLNEQIRQSTWNQMSGQMSDGFGESYDRSKIPDVDSKYRILF